MTRWLLLFSLLFPLTGYSQRKDSLRSASSIDLQSLADQEIQSQGIESQKASEVSIGESSFLKLKDPGLRLETSPWKWTAAFRMQNYSPSGSAKMRNGQDLNLSSVDAFIMPFIEVGSLYQLVPTQNASWTVGASAEAGMGTKETNVRFPTGARAENSRLNTNFVGLNALATYRHPTAMKWEALLGWTEGVVTYSHAADNDGANFSESSRYAGLRLGASYEVSRNWLVGLEQSQRTLRSKGSDIRTPSNSMSLSTRVTW